MYSKLNCPKCDLTFKQESRFRDHLTDVHGTVDHLALFLGNKLHPTCQCSSTCNVLLPWAGWKKGFTSKYARGHNARIDSIYLNKDKQKEFASKRIIGHTTGKYKVWNVGLTKQTNEIINKTSQKISFSLNEGYKNGTITDWRIKDPEKALIVAQKSSITKRKQFDSGKLKQWNDGLTKETNGSLASAAKKISEAYKHREMGNRLSVEQLLSRVNVFADKFELLSSVNDYVSRRVERLTFKCRSEGHVQVKSLAMLEETPVCFDCHPKESKAQLEIFEFVKSLDIPVESCNRILISPKELDIYTPDHKFAIEYNGLYFHSAKMLPDKKYHQNKFDLCHDAGVSLLSIYEDEWRDKRSLVENMIKHRLKISNEVFDARKTKIVQIDNKISKLFFDQNHLEENARSTISFALEDPKTKKILAAMSLRTPFHKSHDDKLEVSRCCCLAGISVRGWLGKLTNEAVKYAKQQNINSLMTYVDSRVGTGDGYLRAGWKFEKTTSAPRFWWTDFHHRYNRFKYKADKSRCMTQQQVADEAGVVPIYGCTNSIMKIDL